MISAWEIYLVMQLDTIRVVAFVASVFCIMVGLFFGLFGHIDEDEDQKKFSKKALTYGGPLLILAALVPSSKTAAAMIVIPAIVNNQTIQKEAGDLYQLAKDGLRELVTPEKPGPKK